MESGFLSQAAKFLQDRKNYKRWLAVFLCLAATVAFGTVAALKLYGQAMTHQVKVLDCQYTVHEHTEGCYDEEGSLICMQADQVIHVHNDDCYRNGELVCPLPELTPHEHDDGCYEEEEVLVCEEAETEGSSGHEHTEECYTLEQGELVCAEDGSTAHTHGEECYTQEMICTLEEHTHDDGCYDQELTCSSEEEDHEHGEDCYTETFVCDREEHTHGEDCYETKLNCEQPESEPHEHTDACYEWNEVLTCTQNEEEGEEGHTHTSECYETETVLTCGEAEPHIHDDGYYSEDCFDENGELLEGSRPSCGKPELLEHVHGAECFKVVELTADEIAAIDAGAALHIHSEECYDQEGNVICGHDVTHIHSLECYDEEGKLICNNGREEETSYVCGKEAHSHDENCFDENGELICELEEHIHDESCLTETEEPEWKCGKEEHTHGEACYDENGELICGLEEHTHDESCLIPAIHLEAEAGDYLILLEASGEAFPYTEEELRLEAVLLSEDSAEYQTTKKLVEESQGMEAAAALPFEITVDGENVTDPLQTRTGTLPEAEQGLSETAEDEETHPGEELFLTGESSMHDIFDLRVMAGEEEIQPEVPVKVSFVRKAAEAEQKADDALLDPAEAAGENVKIFHVDTIKETVEDMGASEDENGNAVISTPHFSTYDVTMDGAPSAQERSGWEGLSEYIFDGITHNKTITIRLTADIEVGTNAAGSPLKPVFADCGRNITLDLNGHKISYRSKVSFDGYETGELFIVGGNGGGGSLTICDSAAGSVSSAGETVATGAAHVSSCDQENRKLTYYKTTSTGVGEDSSALPDTSKEARTTETTTKYTVDFSKAGVIENSSVTEAQALVKVMTGGTLTIESGVLTNAHGRAVRTNLYSEGDIGMTVNLTGGYLVGCGKEDGNGGAVDFEGNGTLKISGDVLIAANKARTGGGVYVKGMDGTTSITVHMDGGAVCGNQAAEMGGGLRLQDATTTLEKCFITNNRAAGQGGGICIPWADFSMKGGLVAANNSDVGGGGIYFSTSAEDNIKQFHLEGGAVSANESGVEGGGIRIDTGYMEIIAKDGSLIYITNNKGNKNGTDWGGGGIFISDNSGRVKIYRTLITENKADGFGGGLGGCSTGRIISLDVANGASVYGNTADGSHLSGSGSSKHQDHDAANSPVFMEGRNFQDVFSALGCYISQGMLSDDPHNPSKVYPANWKGSCDYERIAEYNPVTNTPSQIVSTRMLGLSASPDDNSKRVTQSIANVFITGNYSTTHGGGIMCNGLLLLGESQEVMYDQSLTLELRKAYKSDEGADLSLNQGAFQFQLLDSNRNVITTVSNTSESSPANTNIQILLKYHYDSVNYDEEKEYAEYTYYLKEVIPGDTGMTVYDPAEYRIKVKVRKNHDSYTVGNNVEITRYWVYIEDDSVTVEKKQTDGSGVESWVPVTTTDKDGFGDHGASTSHHGASIVLGGTTDGVRDPLFTNISKTPQLTFWIRKTNSLTNEIIQHVSFTLTRLGTDQKKLVSDDSSTPGSAGNPWIGNTDFAGEFSFMIPDVEGRSYILEEIIPTGYEDAGPWYVETDGKGKVSVYPATEKDDGTYEKNGEELPAGSVQKDGAVYELVSIKNVPIQYRLPETGGVGDNRYYTGAGIMLTFLVLSFCVYSQRRKTRGRRSR